MSYIHFKVLVLKCGSRNDAQEGRSFWFRVFVELVDVLLNLTLVSAFCLTKLYVFDEKRK